MAKILHFIVLVENILYFSQYSGKYFIFVTIFCKFVTSQAHETQICLYPLGYTVSEKKANGNHAGFKFEPQI